MESKLRCPGCTETNIIMMEYPYDHPEHYDGISEYNCTDCGTRWGRWSGKILTGDEYELRRERNMKHDLSDRFGYPKTKAVTVRGEDDLGRFIIGAGKCVHCSKTVVCVKYAPASFSLVSFNIADVKNTLLKDTKNRIGITCGCYAKFHRQIVHIFEKTEAKHRRTDAHE